MSFSLFVILSLYNRLLRNHFSLLSFFFFVVAIFVIFFSWWSFLFFFIAIFDIIFLHCHFYSSSLPPLLGTFESQWYLFQISLFVLNRYLTTWQNQYLNKSRFLSSSGHISSSDSHDTHTLSPHPCISFITPCIRVYRRTSLMSSSLLLQQVRTISWVACLLCLTRTVCEMRGKWPYTYL